MTTKCYYSTGFVEFRYEILQLNNGNVKIQSVASLTGDLQVE